MRPSANTGSGCGEPLIDRWTLAAIAVVSFSLGAIVGAALVRA